ncbi:MAG: glutathione S-transferase C-terminal domain-containing protein [Burkholderiaceae bacterium]|nr:glutathione S-transferase C-terminal domain-containing protein [Sulfuritalea sp.]MCF8176062.1 glutathione S-transferase C-terminal domain-containing protein [Burkholderiaceae bacterium]
MAEYTLHCFAQSGNAYKPALMLALCAADWAPRFVDFFNGATRTPEYRALNVMGEVPVLEHQGQRLSQSGVILDYLAETLGRFGWQSEDERREILRWMLFDNHKFTGYTATYRYLRNFVTAADPAVLAMFRGRAESAWKVLDAHLAGREWIVARRPTIADFSLAGYVFWPEEIGVDWQDYPNIRDWSARIAALPGWQHPYQLMPGHPLPAKT